MPSVKLQLNVSIPEHIVVTVNGVTLLDDPTQQQPIILTASPGQTLSVPVTVTHDTGSDAPVMATVSASVADWLVNISPANWATLPANQTQTAALSIACPTTAIEGTDVCDINLAVNVNG